MSRPSASPGSNAIAAEPVVSGRATGVVLTSREPLSFWGGYDPRTGEIVDRRHPLSGSIATGRILVIPFTRGSSTTTAILLESIRAGMAPAAIVSNKADSFLALASIVADEMFGKRIPILATSAEDFARFETGQEIEIFEDGSIHFRKEAR